MSRLRECRKAKHLTLREVAEHVNLTTASLSTYENDKRSPDVKTLKMLADLYDTTIDYLVEHDTNASTKPKPTGVDVSILREYRIAAGYTTTEVGQLIGVSEPTISNYETGKRKPGALAIRALAKLYNVPESELAAGEPDAEPFAARLKACRLVSGLTQGKVADIVGVNGATLSNYEKGLRWPDMLTAIKLAKLYGVSLDYLAGIEENKNANL